MKEESKKRVKFLVKEEIGNVTDEELINQLKYRMQTKIYESEENSDKRDGMIEEIQLELLERKIDKIALKYSDKILVRQDTWNTEKHENQWFITYDGYVTRHIHSKDGSFDYNEWYDCKIFDAIVSFVIKDKTYTMFFILKAAEYSGGHQRNVKQEIGGYTKAIQKNKNDNYHFIFLLDGNYLNERTQELDICDKYDITNSQTVESAIENFITKKLG